MARGKPSMLALLGLLAVAGYQNRDKISAALGGLQKDASDPNTTVGGIANSLGGLVSGGTGSQGSGGLSGILDALGTTALSGGLGQLIDTFKTAGHAETADSCLKPAVP